MTFRTHPASRTSSDVTARVDITSGRAHVIEPEAGHSPAFVLCRVLKPVICRDILACINLTRLSLMLLFEFSATY